MIQSSNISQFNANSSCKNSDVYHELQTVFNFYFMEVGAPLMSIIGSLGNALNLVVFISLHIRKSGKVMERSSNLGLIFLSASNLLFCLLVSMFTLLPERVNLLMTYFYFFAPCLITYFISTSTWLTVVMSGERYLAVRFPFKAKRIISLGKTKVAILIVFFLCVFANLFLLFEHNIDILNKNGTTKYQLKQRVSDTQIATRRIIWAIVFDFIPCIALFFFNISIIFTIIIMKKRRIQLTSIESVCSLARLEPSSEIMQSKSSLRKCIGAESQPSLNKVMHLIKKKRRPYLLVSKSDSSISSDTTSTKIRANSTSQINLETCNIHVSCNKTKHSNKLTRRSDLAFWSRSNSFTDKSSRKICSESDKPLERNSGPMKHRTHKGSTYSFHHKDEAFKQDDCKNTDGSCKTAFKKCGKRHPTPHIIRRCNTEPIIGHLKRTGSSYQYKASRSKSKGNMNAILIAICGTFLVLVAPSEILKFIYTLNAEESDERTHILHMIKSVTNFLQTTNFSEPGAHNVEPEVNDKMVKEPGAKSLCYPQMILNILKRILLLPSAVYTTELP
ncbi:unnamed protein product [Mytilus coruscus]|uniref:G-protein coupled receptors family 1 profile domain-containing protein n=1 Tax=Mytilus coruscus TaxID=42192 RepID=A0A6J8AGS0_MYTCO|nr:unnamed protein product [Mytilus coruscus]